MAQTGEERLLTLFGDVHYYFGEPSPRPVHHRFDKESYVYLYRDSTQQRGRLEIANHAGTAEQDAFTGYLDRARISQANRHPTLVTIVVDAFGAASPGSAQDEHDWRLPSTDPRDEGNYLFRLHTLDIYFWTVDDAHAFLQHASHTLKPQQLSVETPLATPPSAAAASPRHDSSAMSPVVRNLEHVAISGEQGRSASTTAQVGSVVPTPAPGAPASAAQAAGQQQSFAPLAYNPAAPPAPEEIKHREKTPPPPDTGHPLATAAYADNLHAAGQLPPPPPGAPQQAQSQQQQYLPQQQQQQQQQAPQQHRLSNAHTQKYIPQNITNPSYAQQSPSPQSPQQQPLATPTAEILGASTGHRQPVAHLQPQYMDYLSSRPPPQQSPSNANAAPGLASQHHSQHSQHHAQHASHHYANQPMSPPAHAQGQGQGQGDWAIHQQVYIPGEGEKQGFGLGKGRKGSAVSGSGQSGSGHSEPQRAGRLEAGAERMEKGFNRFLKKVEKKI